MNDYKNESQKWLPLPFFPILIYQMLVLFNFKNMCTVMMLHESKVKDVYNSKKSISNVI